MNLAQSKNKTSVAVAPWRVRTPQWWPSLAQRLCNPIPYVKDSVSSSPLLLNLKLYKENNYSKWRLLLAILIKWLARSAAVRYLRFSSRFSCPFITDTTPLPFWKRCGTWGNNAAMMSIEYTLLPATPSGSTTIALQETPCQLIMAVYLICTQTLTKLHGPERSWQK